jgi:hypothetical protein
LASKVGEATAVLAMMVGSGSALQAYVFNPAGAAVSVTVEPTQTVEAFAAAVIDGAAFTVRVKGTVKELHPVTDDEMDKLKS